MLSYLQREEIQSTSNLLALYEKKSFCSFPNDEKCDGTLSLRLTHVHLVPSHRSTVNIAVYKTLKDIFLEKWFISLCEKKLTKAIVDQWAHFLMPVPLSILLGIFSENTALLPCTFQVTNLFWALSSDFTKSRYCDITCVHTVYRTCALFCTPNSFSPIGLVMTFTGSQTWFGERLSPASSRYNAFCMT